MWARLTRIPGLPPERIDDVVKMFEEQELPMIEQHEGFQGITVMVDPDLGTAAALSLWDSAQNMRASERQAQASREQVIKEAGDQPGPRRDMIVERLEVKLTR